jgi:hypothetical protein
MLAMTESGNRATRRTERNLPELPLPESGLWPYDFSTRVDTYAKAHGVSKKEVYVRIQQ